MKKMQIDRYKNIGKNSREKEQYRQFISSGPSLDKTEEDPINIRRTNESSAEEDEEKVEKLKSEKTGFFLKAKDFFNKSWVEGFFFIMATAILTCSINVYREQGIQGQQILRIEKDIEKINIENKESKSNFDLLRESFNVFKVEIYKDLEFIKKKL